VELRYRNAQHTIARKRGDQSNQLAKLGWDVGILLQIQPQPAREIWVSVLIPPIIL